MEIAIIGAGRLGGALTLALSKKHTIRQIVAYRKDVSNVAKLISPAPEILSADELKRISVDVVFITTPDSEIESVSNSLAERLKNKPFVFHTSGALSSKILHSLKTVGCRVGSLHPLASISNPFDGAKNFAGIYFCVEGEPAAKAVAEQFVNDLKGKSFTVPTEFKTLYHASAVTASGHLVALFSSAVGMLEKCGLNEAKAKEILFPLIESTIRNLSSQTFAEALTGPFARADFETIKLHLETLAKNASPQILETYRQLGLSSLHLAEKQSASLENLSKIKDLMENGEG